MTTPFAPVLACAAASCFLVATAGAESRLAGLFGDGAVLQRDAPVPVWGQAGAGQAITVTFGDQTHETAADASGAWRLTLDPMPADARGRILEARAGDGEPVRVEDVLVGDVWLCSGQSNMAMIVDRARDPEIEKAAADLPGLRVFTVARKASLEPVAEVEGSWVVSSRETAGKFSAMAYFFGRELHRKQQVPVGLIVAAWSGSAIEAWTSREAQD